MNPFEKYVNETFEALNERSINKINKDFTETVNKMAQKAIEYREAEGDAIPDDWVGWKPLRSPTEVKINYCVGRRADGNKFYEGVSPKLFTEQLCKYEVIYGGTEGLCKFCYARKANYEKFKLDSKCKAPSIKADYYGKIGEEIPADAHFQGTDWCKRKARLTEAEPEADADAIPATEGGEQLDDE